MSEFFGMGAMGKTSQLNNAIGGAWQTWEPVITWSGAIPIDVVTIAKYKQIGKTVYVMIHITASDGNNANTSGHRVSLPILPKVANVLPPFTFFHYVGAAPTPKFAYVRDDGTLNDLRLLTNTLTSGSTIIFYISGFYEID